MSVSYFNRKSWLCALFLTFGLAAIVDIAAVAQETQPVPQLERIDIEAPKRRPAARGTTAPERVRITTNPSPRMRRHLRIAEVPPR
jgi:hypothetical protein